MSSGLGEVCTVTAPASLMHSPWQADRLASAARYCDAKFPARFARDRTQQALPAHLIIYILLYAASQLLLQQLPIGTKHLLLRGMLVMPVVVNQVLLMLRPGGSLHLEAVSSSTLQLCRVFACCMRAAARAD